MEGVKLVRVQLTQPHIHEGVDLQPGAEFEVLQEQARWLVNMRVAVIIEKE